MELEIRITLSEDGKVNVIHPYGAQGIRDSVYLLELAKGVLMSRSLAPDEVPS